MKAEINWDCPEKEIKLITEIAQRFLDELKSTRDQVDIIMDITATHLNDVPLDLKKLLKADKLNLAHDVNGIGHHLDRETGKLRNCFLPRCVKGNRINEP